MLLRQELVQFQVIETVPDIQLSLYIILTSVIRYMSVFFMFQQILNPTVMLKVGIMQVLCSNVEIYIGINKYICIFLGGVQQK